MATGEPKRHHTEIPAPKRENFADAGRTDRFYRFSVKCDRAENDKVAKLAKAAGMTPTEFVQSHFERLFVQPKPEPDTSREDAIQAARGKPMSERRVLDYMKALADKTGKLSMSKSQAIEDLSCSFDSLANAMQSLILDCKVIVLTKGSKFTKSTYQIVEDGNG